MKLVWSRTAMRDLRAIAAYLSAESEKGAASVESQIRAESRLISRFPRIGREGRISGTRERVVRDTPFILVYRIASSRVRVLRVYHGARKWPSRFD
jgi:addiction module RelE/StbE family toxin